MAVLSQIARGYYRGFCVQKYLARHEADHYSHDLLRFLGYLLTQKDCNSKAFATTRLPLLETQSYSILAFPGSAKIFSFANFKACRRLFAAIFVSVL